jgi:SLOG family YspA-like protein
VNGRVSHNVIVCGGRRYADKETVFRVLEALHHLRQFRNLMQGGAGGADKLAREWALTHPEITRFSCIAEWKRFGNAAGPIRNARMLEWKPDLVVAFPGHRGTADMVRQAREANVEVFEVKP